MSEEQLTALLAKIKEDAGLQEKLKGAADLVAAMAIAKEAGFDLSNADFRIIQHKVYDFCLFCFFICLLSLRAVFGYTFIKNPYIKIAKLKNYCLEDNFYSWIVFLLVD